MASTEIPAWPGAPGPGEMTSAEGLFPDNLQLLDQIIGERVIVIDHQDHFSLALSMALNIAAAFLKVSWYSPSGEESYTMPAPT